MKVFFGIVFIVVVTAGLLGAAANLRERKGLAGLRRFAFFVALGLGLILLLTHVSGHHDFSQLFSYFRTSQQQVLNVESHSDGSTKHPNHNYSSPSTLNTYQSCSLWVALAEFAIVTISSVVDSEIRLTTGVVGVVMASIVGLLTLVTFGLSSERRYVKAAALAFWIALPGVIQAAFSVPDRFGDQVIGLEQYLAQSNASPELVQDLATLRESAKIFNRGKSTALVHLLEYFLEDGEISKREEADWRALFRLRNAMDTNTLYQVASELQD